VEALPGNEHRPVSWWKRYLRSAYRIRPDLFVSHADQDTRDRMTAGPRLDDKGSQLELRQWQQKKNKCR
jgi:hypothetical protein